jgi:hypothetical protein
MLAIARWVNWPPTLQELITEGAWPIGEPNWLRMAAMVDARMARDEKAWTGAYMIRGDNDPSSPYYQGAKGEVVFCRYLGNAVWANRTQVQAALQTRRQQPSVSGKMSCGFFQNLGARCESIQWKCVRDIHESLRRPS